MARRDDGTIRDEQKEGFVELRTLREDSYIFYWVSVLDWLIFSFTFIIH